MADAILKQVITSWEPRIVNNGVDMNDYHWTVVHGEKDNLIPPSDPYRTYEQAGGPQRWVCYPEGNHVCNNIIYEYRPLVADFMAEHL